MDAGTATVVTTAIVTAKPYLDLVLRGSAKEIGGMFAETAGLWRTNNRLKVIKDAVSKCKKRKVKPEAILPDVLVPLLEAAGDTADPLLSDMFSNLLANNLDPSKQNLTHPSYAKVLSQQGATDAKILQLIDGEYPKAKGFRPFGTTNKWLAETLKLPSKAFQLNLSNLTRLGIIQTARINMEGALPFWTFTDYGELLMQSCSKGKHWLNDRKQYESEEFEKSRVLRANSPNADKPSGKSAH